MHDDNTPYNTLDFMQFVTLTKLVDGKMPAKVEDVEISQVESDQFLYKVIRSI